MKKILIFMSAMYLSLLLVCAISIWVFGYSEPAIGAPFDNFTLGAVLVIPVAGLGALGFSLGRIPHGVAPSLVIMLGLVSGIAFCAWALVAPYIPNTVVNLGGIVVYSVLLGLLSALVASHVSHNAA